MEHNGILLLGLLACALIAAKLFGGIFARLGIPTVLAELGLGIILGNVGGGLGGTYGHFESSEMIKGLSELGVLFLLFMVGLETKLEAIAKVGLDATWAAVLGVIGPFVLAFVTVPLFFPELSTPHILFLAAALTATSVGITARVLQDCGKLQSISGQIILGAAVIDDILGVIVLTVVTAIVVTGNVSIGSLGFLFLKIALFGGAIALVRMFFLERVLRGVQWFEAPGFVTILLLSACLLAAWAAESIGLAGIIGAFALGIILDDIHFSPFKEMEGVRLHHLLKPITDFFTPIFFIYMGMGVKLHELANPAAVGLGMLLIICAIIGKQICGLGIRKATLDKGGDRLLVGFGMIPRGEVGLIFAAIGTRIGILNTSDYGAVILMVVVTTLTAPPLISWRASKLA